MQRRPFPALGPGASLPVIGIGTWQMERDEPSAAIAAIQRAIELGANHVDTAELYGEGRVEELVGAALRGRREQVTLVSKVLPRNGSYEGVLAACARSLKRLGTDYLDLYLLHWRDGEDLAGVLRAFAKLNADGAIRAYGVSNFDSGDLREAEQLVGPGKLACNQVLYHLRERTIEYDLIPACERQGIAVVGYSPFGSGDFPEPSSKDGKQLAELAAKLGATSRQLALAYLTRRPSLFAIPKTSTVAHVEENCAAAGLVLEPNVLARLESIFPLRTWRGLPML